MRNKIELLDCTLRDGAYITGAEFGSASIRGIIRKMAEAGVEIIECGWLKNDPHQEGTTYFHVPDDLLNYLPEKDPNRTYVTMIDWDRYDLDTLPACDGRSIDAIRVVFPHGKHREGTQVAKAIRDKGYKVYLQAANTLAYSEEDLASLAAEVNLLHPEALSVVDTFGAMYPEDLERIVHSLHEKLDPGIALGFHSHNNQQLSFALSMQFADMLTASDRKAIVDASLCGMGRGAGNATTELVAGYLNRKHQAHYDLDAIMDAIDTYMEYYMEKYRWGYSTPYFIAGLYCCHVNNIAYLLKNHRTGAKDMRNIIESLSEADRKKYDYDLLEEKYLKNQSYYVDDTAAIETLRKKWKDKTVLLVAPGRSSVDRQDRIRAFIETERPAVVAVNAILDGYDYDDILFVNPARYEYAESAYPEVFQKTPHIVLSNVKNASENELVIGFNSVIRRGYKYYDNAVICALRLLERAGVRKAAIAGFDGFKTNYNESYGDAFLPSLNSDTGWDELNQEIRTMYQDFVKNDQTGMEICFLTPSIFNNEAE